MSSINVTRKLVVVGVGIVLLLVATSLASHRVYALGNVFFDDAGPDQNTCDVWDWNGNAAVCTSRSMRLKATNTGRVPEGVTTARIYYTGVPVSGTRPDLTPRPAPVGLTYQIQGHHFCPLYTGALGANNRDNLVAGYFADNPSRLTAGQVYTQFRTLLYTGAFKPGFIPNTGEYHNGPGACDSGGANYTRTVPVTSDELIPQPGFPGTYYVELVAQPNSYRGGSTYVGGGYFDNGSCRAGDTTGCEGIGNGFRLINPTGGIIATGANRDPSKDYNVTTQLGTVSLDALGLISNARHSTYAMRFGADCAIALSGTGVRKITLYDIDHSEVPGDNIKASLVRLDRNNNAYVLNNAGYDGSRTPLNPGGWVSTGTTGWYRPDYNNSRDVIQIDSNTGSYQGIKFTAFAGDRYIFHLMDVRSDLVIQYGLPFDGIFYTQPCALASSSVTPVATITDPAGAMLSFVEAGTTVTAAGRLDNNSATNDGYVNARWEAWLDGDATPGVSGGADDMFLGSSPARDYDVPASGTSSTGTIPAVASGAYARVCSRVYSVTARAPTAATPTTTNLTASFDVTCVPIQRRPFFTVMNGDVNATAAVQPVCTVGTSTISAFYTPGTGGSTSQIAAYALGTISEFRSAGGAGSGKQLTFANTVLAPGGGLFGQSYCIPTDYWAGATGDLTTKTEVTNQYTVVTNGDVYITADLPYDLTFASNAIPYRLIAAHNIYIAGDVVRLDGVYAATGTIYTCATGTGTNLQLPNPATNMASACNKQLIVNGSFIGGAGIKLLRTHDTLGGQPAERFIYSPEVWLQAIQAGNTSGIYGTDSITILPPIL